MKALRIGTRTLAIGFLRDVTSEVLIPISNVNGFRGMKFNRIVWLRTPTVEEFNVARAGYHGEFGWLCMKPEEYCGQRKRITD